MKLKHDGSIDVDVHNNDEFVAIEAIDTQIHGLVSIITPFHTFQRTQSVRKVWEVMDRLIALGDELKTRAVFLKAYLEEHDSDYIDESQVPQGEQSTEHDEREDLL